jgi:hypothetical protein
MARPQVVVTTIHKRKKFYDVATLKTEISKALSRWARNSPKSSLMWQMGESDKKGGDFSNSSL